MYLKLGLLTSIFAAIGCGPHGGNGGDMGSGNAGDMAEAGDMDTGPQLRTIRGTLTRTFVGVDGKAQGNPQPRDLAQTVIAARRFDGSTYEVYPGNGASDGTFTIPNVPPGLVQLQVGTLYLDTEASDIKGDFRAVRRADAKVASTDANISVSATQMSAWQDPDMLQLYCPTVSDYWGTSATYNGDGTTTPAVGDTTLTTFAFAGTASAFRPNYYIEAAKGDSCILSHLASQKIDDMRSYQAVTETATLAPFTTATGTTATTSGAFAPLARSSSVTVDVRGSEFAALFPGAPAGQLGGAVGVYVQPTDPRQNNAGNLWDVLDLSFNTADTGPVTMTYGNPRAGWFTTSGAYYGYTRQLTLTGATQPYMLYVQYFDQQPDGAAIGSAPLRPTLGAVQAPLINGKDLHAAQTGVGTTPLLSWTAPKLGTPSYYQVRIVHLTVDANKRAQGQDVAAFDTRETKLLVPSSLLTAGESYVVVISTVRETVKDLSEELGDLPLPYTSMDDSSEIFVP
jgi:hypothetical protein